MTLQKSSLVFNLKYLSQFFIKFNDQGQSRNLLVMRIPKLTLHFRFDAALTEIFKVEDKAQFSKTATWFYAINSGFFVLFKLNLNIEILIQQASFWCHLKALSKGNVGIKKSIKVSMKICTQMNFENDAISCDKCRDFLLHLERANDTKMKLREDIQKKMV